MFPRVVSVRYLSDYKLEVIFSDGFRGISDWSARVHSAKAGGVFEPLKTPEYFAQVEAWEGTIRWPNGADICPDVLYAEVSGKPLPNFEPTDALEEAVEA
jgi:hypothetical protein